MGEFQHISEILPGVFQDLSRANRRAAYQIYLRSPEWSARKAQAIRSAGHRCQLCNSPLALEVHHRTYERFGQERPGDLTVLCHTCHQLFHGKE